MRNRRILPPGSPSQRRLHPGGLATWPKVPRLFARGLALAALAIGTPQLKANPGSLDPTFGSGGVVVTPRASGGMGANAMAVQSDGKIVVAGRGYDSIAVMRYHGDGRLDETFGVAGKVLTTVGHHGGGGNDDNGYSVAIQGDGKIVVGGITYRNGNADLALIRHTPSGGLDGTFGVGGIVVASYRDGADYLRGLAIQPDGKIVVIGSSALGDKLDCALARFNPNGSFDTTFGVAGTVITRFGRGYDRWKSVVIQADGSIVAAGSSDNEQDTDFALARYTNLGKLDTAFGVGGKVITDFGYSNDDYATSVGVQADGKIVVGGAVQQYGGTSYDFALARYQADGTLDPTFSGTWDWQSPRPSSLDFEDSWCAGIAIQPDGKILAAGSIEVHGNTRLTLARYKTNGGLDTTFGRDGFAFAKGNVYAEGWAVVLLPDGKAVVAGAGILNENDDSGMVLARFEGGRLQADARVGLDRRVWRGNNVYADSLYQRLQLEIPRGGGTRTFFIGIQNDGDSPTNFVLKGTAGNRSFRVKYFHGTTDVTDDLTEGTLKTGELDRREIFLIKAKVTALTTKADTVRTFFLRVKPKGCSDGIDDLMFDARSR